MSQGQKSSWLLRWLILGLFYLLAVLLVSPSFYTPPLDYKLNETLLNSVVADFDFEITDIKRDSELRERIRLEHDRVFKYNRDAYNQTLATIDKAMEMARETANLPDISDDEKAAKLRERLLRQAGIELELRECQTLLASAFSKQFADNFKSFIEYIILKRGLVKDKSNYAAFFEKNRIRWMNGIEPPFSKKPIDLIGYIDEFKITLTPNLRRFLGEDDFTQHSNELRLMRELAIEAVVPNVELDEASTKAVYQERLRESRGNTILYKKGDVIAPRNTPIDAVTFDTLEVYSSSLHRVNWLRLCGNALYVLIVYVLIVYFVRKYRENFPFNARNMIMINLPIVLALAIGRLGLVAVQPADYAGYLFPSALIGMIAVIIIGPRLATLLVLWGAMLFGAAVAFDFRHVAVAMFGGLTAVGSLYQFRERRDVYRAGLQVGAVNFISVFIINYIQEPGRPDEYLVPALIGLGNGIACAAVTPFAVGVFEWAFGMVTDMRLLELSGIRHKVLREIEEKIPGTWQHSLNVAKLAEDAANAIGANYLLVRTGAYYHDIGKMENPKYFSENQDTIEDKKRHSKLTPNMSVLIIKNHVKKGIERALEEGLPQQIIDFIPQHHGSCLIKYFYNEAMKKYEGGELSVAPQEDDFRYDGPKPQTIEAAILMLSDSVEATATAVLSKPTVTEDEIKKVVHDTIVDKFNDGQFDECELTLRDLHLISESFTKTLMSRFHQRVLYPKLIDKKELLSKDAKREIDKKKKKDDDRKGNGSGHEEERRLAAVGEGSSSKPGTRSDLKVMKS